MSRHPYGFSTVDQRDQAAEDRDEAAWQRDRVGVARDRDADARDERAAVRMQAAKLHSRLARGLLDMGKRGSNEPQGEQRVVRDLLRRLDEVLREADTDRLAAAGDRRAAAADRCQAAEDRHIDADHRAQAAIERAQHVLGQALVSPESWAELYSRAKSACADAEALCRAEWPSAMAAPAGQVPLRHSELARLRSRMETMPVIEQAKGIIMAKRGCSDAEAFDYLRQASQRLNEPVRDLAVRIVARPAGRSRPAPRQLAAGS